MKLRKVIISTLAAACAVTSVMGFASCDMLSGLMGGGEHTHELSLVKGLDATCTKAGVKDYYTCSGCDGLFSDAEGLNEITSPERIPAGGHQEEIVPAKPATCLEDGVTEGKKCGKCGKVLVQGEAVLHDWITVGGTHYCADTLGDFNVANVSLTYENGEFNLVGNGGTVGAITAENAVLNVGGTLTVTGEDKAISTVNSKLNFVGENVTVNGHLETDADSWLKVDNNAVLTVNGTIAANGAFEADENEEYGYKYTFYIRQGTVNVNYDNTDIGVVSAYGLKIGSEKDNVKGYLNINSGTGDAIKMLDNIEARWMFANGELNCTGSLSDGSATATAICLNKLSTKHVDIRANMKVTVKNYLNAIGSWSGNKYIGMYANTLFIENTANYFYSSSSKTTQRVYYSARVQVQYTDEEGKTGLAYVDLGDNSYVTFTSSVKNYTSLDFIPFPTVEDFDGTNGKFVAWVEAT